MEPEKTVVLLRCQTKPKRFPTLHDVLFVESVRNERLFLTLHLELPCP